MYTRSSTRATSTTPGSSRVATWMPARASRSSAHATTTPRWDVGRNRTLYLRRIHMCKKMCVVHLNALHEIDEAIPLSSCCSSQLDVIVSVAYIAWHKAHSFFETLLYTYHVAGKHTHCYVIMPLDACFHLELVIFVVEHSWLRT